MRRVAGRHACINLGRGLLTSSLFLIEILLAKKKEVKTTDMEKIMYQKCLS